MQLANCICLRSRISIPAEVHSRLMNPSGISPVPPNNCLPVPLMASTPLLPYLPYPEMDNEDVEVRSVKRNHHSSLFDDLLDTEELGSTRNMLHEVGISSILCEDSLQAKTPSAFSKRQNVRVAGGKERKKVLLTKGRVVKKKVLWGREGLGGGRARGERRKGRCGRGKGGERKEIRESEGGKIGEGKGEETGERNREQIRKRKGGKVGEKVEDMKGKQGVKEDVQRRGKGKQRKRKNEGQGERRRKGGKIMLQKAVCMRAGKSGNGSDEKHSSSKSQCIPTTSTTTSRTATVGRLTTKNKGIMIVSACMWDLDVMGGCGQY